MNLHPRARRSTEPNEFRRPSKSSGPRWRFRLAAHNVAKTLAAVCLICFAPAIALPTQLYNTLVNFNLTNGGRPGGGALVQDHDGNFWGTSSVGGANNNGTVFKITPSGTLTTVYSFCPQPHCLDGFAPSAGLILATDGNFYGSTTGGGAHNYGTIFRITPAGALTTLHSFDVTDGSYPNGLVEGFDGNFYGTTYEGGSSTNCSNSSGVGCGTVFQITPSGMLTTLHSFDGYDDGDWLGGSLLQDPDGNFYGSTPYGGSGSIGCTKVDGTWVGCGTIFRISPGGTFKTLDSFGSTNGGGPSSMILGADGNIFGVTQGGGANDRGTVFSMTTDGTITTLYSFAGYPSDGGGPSDLVPASDGNFYGTTSGGGGSQVGSIFQVTPSGTETMLYSFYPQNNYGPYPGALLQGTNGTFYGTTAEDGTYSLGTVFSFSYGPLGPFVVTVPTAGSVGTPVVILGTNLTGATAVTFNGTAATFTVQSSSYITTTVPAGATTGKVRVTTPGGILSTNVPFLVLQQTATPTFSPPGGTYCAGQPVTISDTTQGAVIYYTTDGSPPDTGSPVYTAPITVNSTETIQAIAIATGYTQSAVADAAYTIAPPAASFMPAALTFSAQSIGTSSAMQPVTLNSGTCPLSISSIAISGDFSQTNTCGGGVGGSSSCAINVTFTPTAIGPRKGLITIGDNAPGSPQRVIVTGVGTAANLSPPSLAFGNQSVGSSSAPQTVTLTNSGTVTMNIWQIAVRGSNAGDYSKTTTCTGTLAPAGQCTISVSFSPSGSGPRSASLMLSDDGGGSPQAVPLSGTGTTGPARSRSVHRRSAN